MSYSPSRALGALALAALLITGCSSDSPAADTTAEPLLEGDVVDELAEDGGAEDSEDQLAKDLSFFDGLTGQLVLRDDVGNIVVTKPDGSDQVVLSEPGGDHSQPTWSTEADRVAWSSFGPDGSSLNIADADGTNPVQIDVPSPAFYLSWSPGDSWVAGLRPTGIGMEMFVANPVFETEDVVSNAQPFYFDWSNDDSIVAAVGNQFLVDITANGQVPPTDRSPSSPLGVFQVPGLLPDGGVVVALFENAGNTLALVDDDLVTSIGSAEGPILISVNADGSQIAVVVPASSAQQDQLQEIRFQFEEQTQLEPGRVTVIDLTSGAAETLDRRGVIAVSWSPNGETLAVLGSNPSGFGLQWSFATGGDEQTGDTFTPSARLEQRYLPFFDQYNSSSTWWSPDSTAIVFSGQSAGQSGVFVDRVFDDAPARKVADGDIAFWSPAG